MSFITDNKRVYKQTQGMHAMLILFIVTTNASNKRQPAKNTDEKNIAVECEITCVTVELNFYQENSCLMFVAFVA